MGLPLKFNPEQYYCEQCRPEDHPAIIEALERGESPIDIAARNREEAHSKKKGGRKSKGARVSEVKQEPTPVATTPEQNKRKHTSETPSTQVCTAMGPFSCFLTNFTSPRNFASLPLRLLQMSPPLQREADCKLQSPSSLLTKSPTLRTVDDRILLKRSRRGLPRPSRKSLPKESTVSRTATLLTHSAKSKLWSSNMRCI